MQENNRIVIESPQTVENKSRKSNLVSKLVVIICSVALLITVLVAINFQTISDHLKAREFTPTTEIAELINDIDLTDKARLMTLASHPKLQDSDNFNDSCRTVLDSDSYVLGCYNGGYIYIFNVSNNELGEIKAVTLAHEVLHAAYERLPEKERESIDKEINLYYESLDNDNLRSRIESYPEHNRSNELHSIFGTEYEQIPDSLEKHFSKYFKDRQSVVSRYLSYEQIFQELVDKGEQLVAQIEELSITINELKTDYEDNWQELSNQINDFNYRATNGHFSSEAAFWSERQLLQNEITRLDNLHRQINDYIADYNKMIEEYDEISIKKDELYSSIDSNFSPAPTL